MAAAVVTLFGSTDTFADGGDIAAGVKAGTPGGGVELIVGVSSTLNVRSGFNYFSYEGNKTEGDINYDYDMALSTIPILLDWHPFTRTEFRLTGGVFINNNKADGKSTPQNALKIGGKTYTSAQVGTLTGTADFNSISPYFGIGWGNAPSAKTQSSPWLSTWVSCSKTARIFPFLRTAQLPILLILYMILLSRID